MAESLGVTQSTVSRWESGELPLSDSDLHDRVLKRLVETSDQPVHLICDRTHNLLAASKSREASWSVSANDLLGQSLIVYATDDILKSEATLDALGWHDDAISTLTVITEANQSNIVPIRAGHILWEKLRLSDGSPVRLVTGI
jgi:transcriptional regulator with XRE-family HTH domain